MSLTKKNYIAIALVLTIILFIPSFMYLPIEIDGIRIGNIPLLIANAAFVAATASMMLVLLLILATKKTYIHNQIKVFLRFRHLLFLMIKRDFVTRYRRSALGILWSLLNPLLTMLVLTMVFSHIFRFDVPGQNFPIYLLSGQLIFNFFSEATNRAMGSILSSGRIIQKVYIPKYIFPVSCVLSSLVNMAFSFIAFLLVFLITGENFSWTFLLVVIPIFFVFVFATGVGMILSSLLVFFRDLNYIYGIAITLLMFLTPIFYPVSILPEQVYFLINLNPMFHFVSYFRELTLNGAIPGLWTNIMCIGFALFAFGIGMFVTMTQQDKYILYI